MRRVVLTMGLALAVGTLTASAQEPKLGEVMARVEAYVDRYATHLTSVVAEETYEQALDQAAPPANRRVLRSDYALTRVNERIGWVGFRDTFEVDGRIVRDRVERLLTLLASGDVGQAGRIAEQNARFNLAGELLTRTVNVPTVALELLHPRNRARFSRKRTGSATVDGRSGWVVEFRERGTPTIIRTPNGRDQPSRVVAVVDPITGMVLKTTLSWEKVTGSIVVTYGLVPRIPVPVPLSMSERYTTRGGAIITGEAVYANYRQFETAGRIINK